MVVVGVLIIPCEQLRWLRGLECNSSSCRRFLRWSQKKTAMPPMMATRANTPMATPAAAPLLSPLLEVVVPPWSALGPDPVPGSGVVVGNTVTVS
ncbi:hypothetical protein RRF57_009553 [Xylaria bambusicola]|uniref:Uncharacterized protein n=1 Tax=Xylaria bambusicola TaxID=326684 RepID=A0AAN7UJT4_9PEZI